MCYYGGQIAKNADQKPKVPTQMHFGEKDASIPMSDVEMIKQKRGGDCEIYVYPDAQHGFHCDERGSYKEAAAKTARKRAMTSGEAREITRIAFRSSASPRSAGGGVSLGAAMLRRVVIGIFALPFCFSSRRFLRARTIIRRARST